MNEIDEELATFIEKAISESVDYCEALDKVIAYQKEHKDFIGMHVSMPLDILSGQRKVEDPIEEANKIAKNSLLILLESARGQLKEVTPEELEIM
jgi:hypothetical protein